MTHTRLFCLLALTWVLTPTVAAQSAQISEQYRTAVDSARILMEDALQRGGFPGLSVAVAAEGQLIWSDAVGYADLEQRVPMWPHSRFRIASISKPITAAAVAKLYSQDLLDVDASVQQYVPEFPEKRWTVTTRQLGAHLGGIRSYRTGEMLSNVPYATVSDGLIIFAQDSLVHEPGTQYLYSSYGWNLISAVVAGASGMPFLDYMRQEVFLPFGMLDTVADHPDSLIAHRVRFYVRDSTGTLLNAPAVNNSYKWAGGGFLSTPLDIVRFGLAHLDYTHLDSTAQSLLFTEQTTTGGESVNYGFGWRLTADSSGKHYRQHSGGAIGGTSQLIVQPETGVVVAAMVNMSNADLSVAQELVQLFVQTVLHAQAQ